MTTLSAIIIGLAVYAIGFFHGRRNGYEKAYFEMHGNSDYLGANYRPEDCSCSKPEVDK